MLNETVDGAGLRKIASRGFMLNKKSLFYLLIFSFISFCFVSEKCARSIFQQCLIKI